MDLDFNEKIYSRIMPDVKNDLARINFIIENIPDNRLKILDIGCWDGSHSIKFAKKTNTVYGIESSITSAKRAKKKGIIVEYGDFNKSDFFENTKFDIVVAGEVIEHIFDTDLFLHKIHNVLKPRGKLILTTPNIASLPRRILLLMGKSPCIDNRTVGVDAVGHIRYFTFDGIYEILEYHKFKILKSSSDILIFSGDGAHYSTLIPKIYKKFGKSIMVVAERV